MRRVSGKERFVSHTVLDLVSLDQGGDFRKGGVRSRGEFSFEDLSTLLADDIKNLNSRGAGVENIKIDDDEFELIMNRGKLFGEGSDAIPMEGKMYDVIEAGGGGVLGAMNA